MKNPSISLSLLLLLGVLGFGFANYSPKQITAQEAITTITPKPTPKPKTRACPEGATARCKDGTCSYSKNRRGTCSWHGGVAEWY